MGLLSFFASKPEEYRLCAAAVEHVANELRSKDLLLPGLDAVLAQSHRILNANNYAWPVGAIRKGKASPRKAALVLFRDVSGERAASGQFHVYRGVLGIEGQSLLTIFLFTVDELEKMGAFDAATCRDDREGIRKMIAEVG